MQNNYDNEQKLKNNISPCLYIVPTPIGNLKDITLRALEVLKNVDIIACEDTRRSGLLLKSLDISSKNRLRSYHDYNEGTKTIQIINEIKNGKSVALISDAGTPCISDPGYKLVSSAKENNIKIVSLPGPTALITALVTSGMAVHNFTFIGFPPAKKGRQTFIKDVVNAENTTILYESSHKILKLIKEIAELDSNRNIFISREITKIYEEHISFNTSSFLKNEINIVEKGEFVVIIEGKK
ncbi:MAG: 16S rRNA (cytidine(1402)-2'-O)-methyltransferase [Bacteroidetes bacterium]|nr:16S rRNA (cytidine(1402)-2'-O)-methyltransferase [Bacteroidota bacterium]